MGKLASANNKRISSSIIGISRSISACKRCRKKRIKCSHEFPRCKGCMKANVECVSIDPATGREIPRSYVVHLESEVQRLEKQLKLFEDRSSDALSASLHKLSDDGETTTHPAAAEIKSHSMSGTPSMIETVEMCTVDSGCTAPASFFGASSGISFARLMFTALNFKGSDLSKKSEFDINNERRHSFVDPSTLKETAQNCNMALLPPKQQAISLLSLYFAQSNSQLPLFHREMFLRMYFQPLYGDIPENCSFASIYTSLNRSHISHVDEQDTWYYQYTRKLDQEISKSKETFDPFEFSATVEVPKKFHKPLYFINIVFAIASSVIHLQYPEQISSEFKSSALKYIDEVFCSKDRLESLQGILCLTLYSLMRPCVPGCWYLLGSALRLTVDLGLHWETAADNDDAFKLDIKRRLFWSCYSLDRQICVYLGRPFGIPEECCHVPFPSNLDDALITREDSNSVEDYSTKTSSMPSYKSVSLTMFRIRKLQAEVRSVLYDGKELPRKFRDLNEWYRDISERLQLWLASIPKTLRMMNCNFNSEFFNLNYDHTRIMLNGLSPAHFNLSQKNYMTLVEASMDMILSYYQLYTCKLLNYTWAATHNLFMAGTSFLYSIFNCEDARNSAPLSQVQRVVLCCNLILNGIKDKCNAASHCKDVFEILAAAVIKLKYTDNNIQSVDMSSIPSNEQIAQMQPGRHLPENVRNLVSSLPESIRSHELDLMATRHRWQQSLNDGTIHDASKIKREGEYPALDNQAISSLSQINIPNISLQGQTLVRAASQPITSIPSTGISDTSAERSNIINEADLNRFFDELQKIQSPESSNRSSGNNDIAAQQSISALQSAELQALSSNYGHANYVPLESHSNQYMEGQGPYIDECASQQFRQSSIDVNTTTYTLPGLQLHSKSPEINELQNFGSSAHGLGINGVPGRQMSQRSKEGQRVFNMIYQVPTESIWDQFFTTPYAGMDRSSKSDERAYNP
ncbi:hypothetical protein FOA43_003785 [Brettanomyces nanus]|uniref:Zn(2)-C6 fungal-type domain-containing protein n=1 Tax=Eeniella nana TaxID=13502 RepID=A0A875S528_EENNA|nr:uncharacterized protein FOA43_003785 [Brettanomyces nanus]QPG76396.1 hypothetical protein FOA43_003785 [Brettanomyces nanus]